MKCYIIAQVVDAYNKLIGYKLFDADKGDTMIVDVNQLKTVLSKQPDLVKNATLINGILSGTNGKLDRYARVNKNGNLVSGDKSPLVIINKIDNVGYTVVDFKGQTARMSNEKAVDYAKENGIANGKVVMQDSIEFISSISGEYDIVKLAPSKAGANTRVNIPIRIGGDAASVAKHTAEDIETEMEYNDVFSAMNGEQRSVLKQYYTWYTVDAYQKMAKNVRLDLAPGKAEKLAQLRGIDKWEFAGINDSYMEGNFKAHCELGHRLRYEYFAIPEGVLDENHNIRTRDKVSYMRARKDTVQDLRDAGAIVFGETCAGDFFNISPEDMKKLVKTRKTMSDEIELMSNILTNHLEESYKQKCKLLCQIIAKLGNTENVIKVFGDNVGYTLLAFMKAKMPFPMSLVILAADQARKDLEKFYINVFPEYKDIITLMLKANKDISNNAFGVSAGGYLLEFIATYTLEGEYQYDPVTDQENIRKDIGRYNKDTRSLREAEISTLILSTSVNVRIMNDIDTLINYFKAFKFYYELSKEVDRIYKNTILSEKYTTNRFAGFIQTNITNRDLDDENKYGVPYYEKEMVMVISSLNFIKEFAETLYMPKKYGSYYNYGRATTFKGLRILSYSTTTVKRVDAWKNIAEIAESVDNLLKDNETCHSVANKALKPLIAKLDALEEAERTKDHYYKFDLKLETRELKYKVDNIAVAKLDYISNKELKKAIIDNNTTYGVNTNNTGDDNTILLNVGEFYEAREISESDYEYYLSNIERNRDRDRKQREVEERLQREEQEKLLALAEKQRKEAEEAAKREMEEEAKLDRLQELINKYNGDKKDYGVQTAQAILNQGLTYRALSPKQKWRIDKTLKDLENQSKSVEYDLDSVQIGSKADEKKEAEVDIKDKKDDTEKKTENKPNKSLANINEDNLKALNDEDAACAVRLLLSSVNLKTEEDGSIAFSTKVALTINNTGKISEKQKNYLMKGYNKLRERLK